MSEINIRIGHLDHLESPWGNAGGVVKTVEHVEAMANTGVGWIEAGSYTLEERYGNDRDPLTGKIILDPDTGEPIKVYYHNPNTGETFNSLGMPNKGMDKVKKEIPEMVRIAEAKDKKLVVNVAPVTDDPITETRELVQRAFEAGAHGVIVNGGCPNVETQGGERHKILSHDPRMTYLVLRGLWEVTEKYNKVYFRGSPQPTYDHAKTVYRQVGRAGTVSAVWLPNSWGGSRPVDEEGKPILGVSGGIGGKTGPATVQDSLKQLRWAVEIFNGNSTQSVLSGGVMDHSQRGIRAAETLKKAFKIGAVAAAGSTFYFENPNERADAWQDDTYRLLHDLGKIL